MSFPVARRLMLPALGLLLLLLAAVAYTAKVSEKMPDFEVYWRAGERAAAAEPLYRDGDGHYQLKYLPAFAIIVMPVAMFDPPVAKALWFGSVLAALALLVGCSVRLCVDRRKSVLLLVAITVAVMAKFYARELVLGQVNAMFAATIAVALLAMRERREVLAGGLLALAVVLKPYGLLFAPWLLARRRASVVSFAGGLVVALLMPLVRYTPAETVALHRDWWETILTTTSPNLMNPDNVSWLAMYERVGGYLPAQAPAVLWAATALGAAALLVWMWARRGVVRFPDALEGALILLLVPLVSPQGWDYVLLAGTPAVMLLVNHEATLPRSLRVATLAALVIIGVTIYDLLGRQAYHGFLMASGLTVCTLVLIAALGVLRARAVA